MAFIFYGDKTKAIILSGATNSEFVTEMEEQINNWINLRIGIIDFFTSSEVTEYYDIPTVYENQLLLNNYPVIIDTLSIYNSAQSTPVLINASNYFINLDTGIIQILDSTGLGSNFITSFTKGFKQVKVIYKYGYANIPNDVKQLATLVYAKWGAIKSVQADADGLKSVKISNYTESFDLTFLNIKSEFDGMIFDLINKVVAKYNKGV